MMKKLVKSHRYLFLGIVGLLMCSACDTTTKENTDLLIIQANDQYVETPLSEIGEIIKVIPLETTDNLLIPGINHLAYNSEELVITSFKNSYRFSSDGKFLNYISANGQGPGELNLIQSANVDWQKKQVVLAGSSKLARFQLDGSLLQEVKLPLFTDAIHISPQGLKVLFTAYAKKKSANNKFINETFLTSLDEEFNLRDSVLIRSVEVEGVTGFLFSEGHRSVSQAASDQFIYHPVLYNNDPLIRDTLYQIQDNQLVAALKLDLGISNKEENNLIISSIIRTPSHLYSSFTIKGRSRRLLHHFESGITHQVIEGFEDDIYNTGKVDLKALNTQENIFYFIKEGIELEGIIDNVTADDNPYVFIVKLKD